MKWVAGVVGILCLAVPAPTHAAHGDGARININTADVATLDMLTGIGEVLAERIVEYRETQGLFTTTEDIINVSGIGPQSYADIEEHITVADSTENAQDTATTTQSEMTTETVFNTVTQYQYETVAVEPPQDVHIRIESSKTTFVGAPAVFRIEAYDATGSAVADGVVQWSFGDGGYAYGREVQHSFMYAGEYNTTVSLEHGALFDTQDVAVTVVPLTARLRVADDATWIAVKNGSEYVLDVSNWRFVAHGRYFNIPEGTRIPAQTEVKFPDTVTKLKLFNTVEDVRLMYPNGTVALVGSTQDVVTHEALATSTEMQEPKQNAFMSVIHATSSIIGQQVVGGRVSTTKEESIEIASEPRRASTSAATVLLAAGGKESPLHVEMWYLYIGFIALLVVLIGILVFTKPKKLVVEGFEVIESKE